ncbi:MAG: hypothetical protein ACLQVD_18200 [Capsulimonadaceae bacterium]
MDIPRVRRVIGNSILSLAIGASCALVPSPSAAATVRSQTKSAPSAAAHNRRTPPDSYLQFKVYSVDELVAAVQSSAHIRHIYSQTFRVPENRVIQYMRANLIASYVPETQTYTCYCAHPDGTVYPTKQTFRRGTKVFALRNGQPVLKWLCGNPLSRFLPAVEVHEVPVVKVSPSVQTLTPVDKEDIILPSEEDTIVPSEVDKPVYQPSVPALVNPAGAIPHVISLPSAWWALGAAPLAFAHDFHESSSGGGSSVPLVPEPSGAVASMLCLLGISAWVAWVRVNRPRDTQEC